MSMYVNIKTKCGLGTFLHYAFFQEYMDTMPLELNAGIGQLQIYIYLVFKHLRSSLFVYPPGTISHPITFS